MGRVAEGSSLHCGIASGWQESHRKCMVAQANLRLAWHSSVLAGVAQEPLGGKDRGLRAACVPQGQQESRRKFFPGLDQHPAFSENCGGPGFSAQAHGPLRALLWHSQRAPAALRVLGAEGVVLVYLARWPGASLVHVAALCVHWESSACTALVEDAGSERT